nr:hypothetical protein [Tanacetum cinerariifolium]
MKEGATKTFTKMLSVKAPESWVHYRVLDIRNNGEAIIENLDDTNYSFRPLGLNLTATKQVEEAAEIWGFHIFETGTVLNVKKL